MEMFFFGQYSHTSACCKKAQSFLGLTQIFPLVSLTPLPLLLPSPYEVPSHGKYNHLRVELLQRCLRELGAQVLLIFNKTFIPRWLWWKWWLHHSCLPLHLYLMAFVIRSPCIQPHISGITKSRTDTNNHGHMQTNPHCGQSKKTVKKGMSCIQHASDVTSKSEL